MTTAARQAKLCCPCGAGLPMRMLLARHLHAAHGVDLPRAILAATCAEDGKPWPADVLAVFRAPQEDGPVEAAPAALPDTAALDAASAAYTAPGRAILTTRPPGPSRGGRRGTGEPVRTESGAPRPTRRPGPPAGTSGNGAGTPAPLRRDALQCWDCGRKDGTHTPGCRRGPCKLCTRLGEPCGHHGGRSHSTERRGRGRPSIADTVCTLNDRIARLEGEVCKRKGELAAVQARLVALVAERAAVREALGGRPLTDDRALDAADPVVHKYRLRYGEGGGMVAFCETNGPLLSEREAAWQWVDVTCPACLRLRPGGHR